MGILWLIVTGGGAFILGLVVAYAMLRNRPLRSDERVARDRKIRELYHKDE